MLPFSVSYPASKVWLTCRPLEVCCMSSEATELRQPQGSGKDEKKAREDPEDMENKGKQSC